MSPNTIDNHSFYQQAKQQWEAQQQALPNDPVVLQQMLKEAQIKQLEWQLAYEKQQEKFTHQCKLLASIIDVLPTAVFVKDITQDYRFILWNKKAEELFGLSAEDCIGKCDYDFFSKEDADSFRQKDLESTNIHGTLDIPEEIIDLGEKRFIVHTQKTVVRDEDNTPRFLVGISENISEQKKAERLLRETSEKYQAVFNGSNDAIMLFMGDTFIDCNPRTLEVFGIHNKADFVQMHPSDISPPFQPDGSSSYEISNRMLEKTLEEGSCRFEWWHQRMNGELFNAEVSLSLINYAGSHIVQAIIQDITEKKKKDIELKKLSLVAQKTHNAVIILDANMHIEWVNEGFEHMTGYTYDEAVYQQLSYLIGNPEEFNLEEQLELDTTNNKSSLYEIQGYHKNKQPYWRSTSITPFQDNNGAYKYIVIESDITEQKRIADVLKESEELAKAKEKAENSEKRLNEAQTIAHLGYWELDVSTNHEVWSDELYRIFELKRNEVIPSEAELLKNIHPEDREYANQTHIALLKEKKTYQITYRLLLHNGKLKYVSERCRSEFDSNGKRIRSMGTILDITEQKISEENLTKSLKAIQDLKYALDQSSMVVTIDKAAKIVAANSNFCKVSGYSEEELQGHEFNMADSNHHSKWFLMHLWDMVKKGSVWKGPIKNRAKDGSIYWADTAIVPFMDETDKTPFQYVIIQRDITEKKRLEEELELANEAEFAKLYKQQTLHLAEIKEQSTELDRFFNLSIDMISVVNSDGYIKRINPAFSKVLGYTEQELFECPLLELVHPDDLEHTQNEIAQVGVGQDVMDFENRYRTKNGEYRWMSWRAVLDKETNLLYAITRDVTEAKIASRKIGELTHTLNQTAIVMIVDKDERIISVNDKFCEISGYSKEEVIGQHHELLDSFHHPPEFWEALRATITSGKIWQGEIKERAKDGSFYWTDTSSVPFLDETGEPFQYIVIQSNITAKKQLEEELREAEEEARKNAKIKEDFLANMSHEIRTPMSGVLGFSRLLLQTSMTNTQYNYAQSIYSSAENLLIVVNDILDVSKIESGKFQLDEIEFNFRQKVYDSLNIFKIDIRKKALDFIIKIDDSIPQSIVSAPDRIAQILINLVGNAFKFTKEGYVKLEVQLQDDNQLYFAIEDTGIGIPENKLDTIFESFTQAENYTTREHGGTGLGLSICQKLVTLMGGEIGVRSQVKQGSTFYFTLPFKTVLNQSSGHPSRENKFSIAPKQTEGAKILVVEDNLVNQELALIYLGMLHCQYDLANNGEEAIEKLATEQYDLILMDIQMPKMDGIAATLAIRKTNQHTPIIAMTAHALSKEKEKCFEIGMNDYISKPFKIEQLQSIIIKHTTNSIVPPTPKLQVPPVMMPPSTLSSQLQMDPLIAMMDGNRALAVELLGIFKGELLKFTQMMEQSIQDNDVAIIRKHVHKIRPNFELLQLMELDKISEEIHGLSANLAPVEEVKRLYQKIKAAVPSLLEQIELETTS